MKVYADLHAVMRLGRWLQSTKARYVPLWEMIFGMIALVLFALMIPSCSTPEAFAGDLSPNFSRQEFNQKRPGHQLPLDQVKVDPELVRKLEALRAAIGNKPIKLNSGYRSPEYNRDIARGAKHSQHMHGKAADIVVDGMTSKQLEVYAKKVGFTFTQTYEHLPHLHVDVR